MMNRPTVNRRTQISSSNSSQLTSFLRSRENKRIFSKLYGSSVIISVNRFFNFVCNVSVTVVIIIILIAIITITNINRSA